nr:hypothetical protein BN993_06777 [Virgibacillus halodenitrificans]
MSAKSRQSYKSVRIYPEDFRVFKEIDIHLTAKPS